MVRSRRLELPRGLAHSDLNAARLPVPPRPHRALARSEGNSKSNPPPQGSLRLDAPPTAAHIDGMQITEPEWRIAAAPVSYEQAVAEMEARVEAIQAGRAGDLVWLLEHPPLYTAGTSGKPSDLIDARF